MEINMDRWMGNTSNAKGLLPISWHGLKHKGLVAASKVLVIQASEKKMDFALL